jgi:hypothetical protein
MANRTAARLAALHFNPTLSKVAKIALVYAAFIDDPFFAALVN